MLLSHDLCGVDDVFRIEKKGIRIRRQGGSSVSSSAVCRRGCAEGQAAYVGWLPILWAFCL